MVRVDVLTSAVAILAIWDSAQSFSLSGSRFPNVGILGGRAPTLSRQSRRKIGVGPAFGGNHLQSPTVKKNRITATAAVKLDGLPATDLTVGIPKEVLQGERRVSATPESVALLTKEGYKVRIEAGAGAFASYTDDAYAKAGATIVDTASAWSAEIVLKVNAPSLDEVQMARAGGVLISFIQPAQRPELMDALKQKGMTTIAMDCLPRTISRAQTFDALSSMANIAGYRAVVEASNAYGRFFAGQFTAAGKVAPSKVLVIGAGVAGLAAIQQVSKKKNILLVHSTWSDPPADV